MKKIIAVLLAVVLVAGGLGSVAYAQDGNEINAGFRTDWVYTPPGDSFSNEPVTGFTEEWHADLRNQTTGSLSGVELSLASDVEFERAIPDPVVTTDPRTYHWSFDDLSEGAGVGTLVGFYPDSEQPDYPITFTPGFDASRSVYPTVFEGTGVQTIDITVVPRQDNLERFCITVITDTEKKGLVNAIITSPTSGEGIELVQEGHRLNISPTNLVTNELWTITVKIDVTPKVPKVEYTPYVGIGWDETVASGSSASVSYVPYRAGDVAHPVGTWEWSVDGIHNWHWREGVRRFVKWFGYCRDITNYVWARFVTNLNYGPWPDTFTNGDEISLVWENWEAKMGNSPDGTGANVTALTLSLDSEVPFRQVRNGNLTKMGPPTYEWFFGDIPQGSGEEQAKAGVGLMSEDYDTPITFTPGFDASRSVDKAVFLESEGTQTQTLTVTVTPRERTELHIGLGADENDLISPLIISAISGDGVEYPTDGQRVNICPITGLQPNTTWTLTVTFLVTPKVPKVRFIPYVEVGWRETIAFDTVSDSSVSYPAGDPADKLGTWTWSAEGSYEWHWIQELHPCVHWFTRCREMPVAQTSVEPYLAPVGQDFVFDGSASSGAIVSYDWDFGDGNVGSSATVPHAYALAGLYNIVLTVTDDRGAQSSDSVMAVVYDPAAGFATGGGWLIPGGKTSYNDDFLPEIDGTSPANFGFVVKYKKGASNPDGQLEFQYRQGDFNLHSSGMEWLVITNKNWAKFHGMATIKGFDGLYPFQVDARDGDFGGGTHTDRFIIKVYAPEDTDQSDPIYKASGDLEGGSIVIHGKGYEVTTLRLQSWFPSDHPWMTPLEKFAQAVEQGTEGSVRIELYPSNALVPGSELAKAVEWGEVEMGLLNSMLLRDYSRVMDAGWLPFLYNDDDGLMNAVWAGIGDLLSEELQPHNITAIDWTTMGISHLFLKDEMLIRPEDVIEKKIRAPGIQGKAISQWGGTAVMMPIGDVYKALENRDIHGASFNPYLYYVLKLYEVVPYFSVDYAFANLAGLCINSDVWNSLDEETRDIITTAAGAYVDEMLVTVKQVDEAALETIKGYGVEVYTLTPEERAVWRDASQAVWDGWVQEVGLVGRQIIDIALEHNPLP